jgi:hypothetical protein
MVGAFSKSNLALKIITILSHDKKHTRQKIGGFFTLSSIIP